MTIVFTSCALEFKMDVLAYREITNIHHQSILEHGAWSCFRCLWLMQLPAVLQSQHRFFSHVELPAYSSIEWICPLAIQQVHSEGLIAQSRCMPRRMQASHYLRCCSHSDDGARASLALWQHSATAIGSTSELWRSIQE